MKISPTTFLIALYLSSATCIVSAQPFRLVNGNGENILKAIADKKNEEAAISAPRIRIPNTSASVVTSEKPSETPMDIIDLHRRFGPTDESLTKDEASFLEDTIRNAYETIRQDRDSNAKNNTGKPGLRGSKKTPFIPIDREVLKRYEERIGKSF